MSADFTPEKEDYKILTPFKMQVLTNFPYIEADFDALTNYQLLCKVVEYLNNVITNENEVTEQVTSLYNAYVSLQNYVNNYFDTLDLQGEVSIKLDEMATDGSLTNLIKDYVDPIYQEYETTINGNIAAQNQEISSFKSSVNDEIEVIDNKVTSATSGSPAGVYSTVSALTTADPNHNKIYLVTEDGKWYYYNTSNSTWTAGGTYQSSGIPEELENAKNTTIDTVFIDNPNFRSDNLTSADDWHTSTYRDPVTGQLSQSQYTTGYCCSDFYPVTAGTKYLFKVTNNNYGTLNLITFDDTKTNGTNHNLGYINVTNPEIEYTIPDGCTYISINLSSNGTEYINNIYRLTQYDYEKDFILPRLNQKMLKNTTIVNFGDSIFGNGYGENAVSNYIEDLTNATVYNCAFGGCRMGWHSSNLYDPFSMYRLAHAIATNDWSLQNAVIDNESLPDYFPTSLTTLKGIDFSTVDIVTISYGTNDFADGLVPWSDNPNPSNNKFYYYNLALRYSIEELLNAYPNLRIFIITPFYRFWTEGGSFVDDSNTHEVTSWISGGGDNTLIDFIDSAMKVAKEYQLPFINTYYNIGFNKLNRSVYYADTVHQNLTGRQLIADYIVHELY